MPLSILPQRSSKYTESLDFVAGLGNSFTNSSFSARTSATLVDSSKRVMESGIKNLINVAGLGNSIAHSSFSARTSATLIDSSKRVMESGNKSLDFVAGLRNSIASSSLPAQSSALLDDYTKRAMEFFNQSHIRKLILTYGITSMALFIFIACLGFGPIGVGAGTLAAVFQSIIYGGLVPAGGFFATLTSMGILGTLLPAAAGGAAIVATLVTIVMWARGRGR